MKNRLLDLLFRVLARHLPGSTGRYPWGFSINEGRYPNITVWHDSPSDPPRTIGVRKMVYFALWRGRRCVKFWPHKP